MNKIEQGIDYIRTHGSATGEALASVLGCPKKNVQPMLYLALTMGYLATSKQCGSNIYRISEIVPEGMSWETFKASKRVPKVAPGEKPPSKAKVIVEKPERTPAEVRNALADLFERRALGLPAAEDDTTSIALVLESAPGSVVEVATPRAVADVPRLPATATETYVTSADVSLEYHLSLESAQARALAIACNGERTVVYKLVPVGTAVPAPGAEWASA
jgi:hypothetical protein